MQLNASTYETIFLLYIDNELSPKERLEVELWIAEHPTYALRMEELKATILVPETMQFGLKANLKKTAVGISKEVLEEDTIVDLDTIWTNEYTNLLKQDMQAIPGLSKQFKNSLKKETSSKGGIIKAFGFSQNKFTYTAVAAMLMLFIGYKQLAKTTINNSISSNSPVNNTINENAIVNNLNIKDAGKSFEANAAESKTSTAINVISSSSKQRDLFIQKSNEPVLVNTAKLDPSIVSALNETIVNTETSVITSISNSTSLSLDKSLNELPIHTINTTDTEESTVKEANPTSSFEVIDTEDPDRTILIANFEIDGNRLRGLKRKVTSLFKNNKSDKNK
jgi:hypothetical protein